MAISLARNLLGYEPKVELDEGLERTIAWYCRMFEEEGPGVRRPAKAL